MTGPARPDWLTALAAAACVVGVLAAACRARGRGDARTSFALDQAAVDRDMAAAAESAAEIDPFRLPPLKGAK